MKSKFGSKALSLLLSLTMVLSLFPAMTLPASAAVLPSDASTPGKGYYPNAAWDTGKYSSEPAESDYGTHAYWEAWAAAQGKTLTHLTALSANQTLSGGIYYIDQNITVPTPSTGKSGLVISGNVTLILENGVTLTVTGGAGTAGGNGTNVNTSTDGSCTFGVGAGAGIELNSSNYLHIIGSGTVNATGGNAGSGGNGGDAVDANTFGYGGGGGGGAGAGIGSNGANGGYGQGHSQGSDYYARLGATAKAVGTLVVTGNVIVNATGGSGNNGGTGGNISNKKISAGGGGGGGGGGDAYAIGSGGYGGGGGSVGTSGHSGVKGNGGNGGNGYTGGSGGAGKKQGSAGSSGTGSYGSNGTAYKAQNTVEQNKTGASPITIWPKDECKFEVVGETSTGYNADNQAWMYTGSSLKPSIKVTHIPTGKTTTVSTSSNSSSYTYGSGNTNIFGSDGYGSVKVAYNTSGIRLVPSNASYSSTGASQTLYFPIKETVTFKENATEQKANLISQGFTADDAVVSNMPEDKVLQVGVTEKTDAELATANVPTLPGYTFLGWYYYADSYFASNGELDMSKALDSNKNPTGVRIYNPDGKLNEDCGKLNSNGTWNGVDGSKAITKLYAMWKQADITLVLNARGGSGGGTFPNQKFGSYLPITAPTRTGYTFDGYYDEKGYADGKFTGVPVAKMENDEMVYLQPDGKTYGKNSDGSADANGLKLKQSCTLYAKWKPLEYTVRLWSQDENGESQFLGTLKNVESGALLLPENGVEAGFNNDGKGVLELADGAAKLTLERNHYDFMGWNLYSDQDWAMFTANKESKFTPNSATVGSEGLDIYAAWKIKDNFDIQYNGNEGSTNGIKTGNVFKGETYTIPETLPTRAGYSFTGWNTALNGSGEAYQPGDTISNVTKAMTLYAQWTENHTITYNANGGTFNVTLNALKPAKGEQVELTIPSGSNLYRTGYEFLGWATTEDATEAAYTSANPTYTMGDESVILYAVWKPVQVEIEYKAEDGQEQYFTWGENPTAFTYGTEATFTIKVDTTKAGANTLHVSVNGNAKSVGAPTVDESNPNIHIYTFKVGGNVTEKQTVTVGGLTARSYNVSLNLGQGGTIEADKNLTYYVYGVGATLPTDGMAKKGYTFDGWYADEACTGSKVTNISSTESGDKTFYAKWTANTYTVKYDGNGDSGQPQDGTAAYDAAYTIAAKTDGMTGPNGAEFLGWSTDKDAVSPEYKAGDTVLNLATGETGDKEITLYAVWKVQTYTVNYVLLGGTADGDGSIAPTVVKSGASTDVQFPEMSRKGYSFVGWATSKDDSDSGKATYAKDSKEQIDAVDTYVILYAVWEPITYNIVFHNGDDEATDSQENLEYGTSYALKALSDMSFDAPEGKDKFLGWATHSDATVPQYLDGQEIKNLRDENGTYDLYAVWGDQEVIYLSYNANGGTYSAEAGGAPEATPASNGTVTIQFDQTPTMEGYTFDGWQTKDGQNIYRASDASHNLEITENTTLYAKWTANKYTIHFGGNGATSGEMEDQAVEYDKSEALTQNAFERLYYHFLGWSERDDAESPTYQDQQYILNLPTKNGLVNLFAIWQQEDPIYITYNANGGSSAPATTSAAKSESVTISSQLPTRDGYTFLGWATTSDAEASEYEAGQTIQNGFNDSTTLYAVWQLKQTHKVSYDVNGGYGSFPVDSNSYYEDDTVNVRFDLIPAKSGYTFAGWKNGDTIYSNQDGETFTMADADVTLTAQWTANHYTVKFNAGSGSGSMDDLSMTYGTAANLTKNGFTAPTGYRFAGWAVAVNGGVTYEDHASVQDLTSEANGEVTLYAVWTPLTVTVTLNKDYEGGTEDTVNAIYGQQLPVANQPARDGYTFGGYYTEKNGSGTQYYDENMVPQTADFTKDTTLHAKWTAKTYQIVYMQDVNTEAARQNVTYGTTPTIMGKDSQGMSLTIPDGYKLAGWAISETGKVVYKAGDEPDNLWNGGNAVVLYAVFKKDVTYTVKYEKNGGTGAVPVDSKKYEDGDFADVQFPAEGALYNNGSQFLGWSTDENASDATYTADGDNKKIQMTDNVTLYAVWVKGTYNVKYNGNGGTLTGQQDHIDNVEMLRASYSNLGEIYQRSGYTFNGWNRNQTNASKGVIEYGPTDVLFPALTDVAGSTVTLYAAWTANEYKVTFDPDDGTVYETERTVTYDKNYGTLPIPTREGYTFLGWFNGDTEVKGTTVVQTASNHTLTAKWQGQQYTVTANTNNAGNISMMAGENELISGSKANVGTEITVTVTPRENYTIDNVTLYVNGTPVSMSGDESNTYTFTLAKDTEVALKANGNTGAKYTVKYDANNGTGNIADDSSFVVGKSATLSDGTGFTRNGYNLTGWNTRADGKGTSYGLGTEQTTALTQTAGGTVTLYAQWSATNCTVNFVAGEGAQLNETSKDVTFGKAYGTLPTPTKDGSVFDGWYLNAEYEGDKITSSTIVANAESHTLYAKWVSAQYTVTVKDNGVGTIALTGVDENNKAAAGTDITVTVTPRENHTIANVKLYVNGNPVSMTGDDKNTYTFALNADAVISLEENSNIGIKYTVAYDANGGKGSVPSVEAVSGTNLTLKNNGFTKDGSTLTGWNTKEDGTGKAYSLGETVKDLTLTPGGTVTLYAQWNENDPEGYAYTIRYEANGGTGDAYTQTMHQNRLNVALYDGAGFSRAGYALVGWANTPDGAVGYQLGGKLSAPLASQAGATTTLYAVWEKDAIRVTLVDDQKVNTVPSLVLKTGNTYANLPNLSKTGYVFEGWFTEQNGGTRVDNSTEVTATTDHTLYAHWTEKAAQTYTVTVNNANLGNVTLNPQQKSYAAGTEITVTVTPAASKTVKLISSVDGEIALTENTGKFTGKFTVTKDTNLTLVEVTTPDPGQPGQPDNAWYLFFDGNGGTGSMAMQTVTDGKINAPASAFTRDGYTFAGWKDGNGNTYAEGAEIAKPKTGKVITLYAQWKATAENTYTVTFDAQGGTMTESKTRTYHAGDKYGTLPTPTKSGDWSFGGWYSDSALTNRVYDTTTVPTRSHTLYAKWVSRTAIAVTAVGYDGQYDGASHALNAAIGKELTGTTYQWFKDGNAIVGATGKTYYVKNVADSGKYTCLVSGSYNGVGYTNLKSTTAIVKITRKQLTVTAANAAVIYGSEAPAYALSYSGFAAADDASVLKGTAKAICAYAKGNNVGEYGITVDDSGLTAANYSIKTVNGKLTVKQLPVSLEWSGTKLEATGSEKSVTATVKNAVGSDTFALVYKGNTGTDVGNYSAKVTALGNGNYTLAGATGVEHNWVIYKQGTNPSEVPDPTQPDEPEKTVTGITLNPTSKTLKVNEEFTLTYKLQPDGATDTVTFTSSDNSIASVDNSGKVTAKASGTAVITATTSGGLTATCTVIVSAKAPEGRIPVTGITVQYTSYKMTKSGQTFNVGAKVQPNDATNQEINYSSSNNAVATVDATGKVTAISSGTATIYAQTDDGGYTLICTVTVEISSSGTGGSTGGGSIGGGGSSGGGSSSGGSTGGTTGGNTSGGSISAGGTGNTAYSGCKHDKNCPIYPFNDAFVDAWYHDGVHYCIDNGLMGGYGDGKFGPNDQITRSQIVMILWRIAGSPNANYAMNFTDVADGAWYAKAIRWATSVGVASGYGDGKFGPNDFITREQFAAMLYRFAQLQGKDVSRGDTNTLNGYTDAGTISSYALTAMKWANGMGVISGTDNSTLMPKGNATRAQAACMIQRYIINLAK